MSHTRTICTQSVRVLDYIHTFADRAVFTRLPDEPGDIPSVVEIDVPTYVDMGSPEQITVTIQPHDLLNGDA